MGILFHQTNGISKRSQKRFLLSIPLELYGKDASGHVFTTRAILCNASPDGGCVVIDKDLTRGQFVRVASPKGDVFPARVCWETYSFTTDQRHLGFKLEGGKNHWVLKDKIERDSETFSV